MSGVDGMPMHRKQGPTPLAATGGNLGHRGSSLLGSLRDLFGRTACDPDISRKDLQAIRGLVRSLPLVSGPILSVSRADEGQRPEDCEAAEVFLVMTGTRPAPLCGQGECLVVAKQSDGRMVLADRQAWVS